MSPLGTLLPSMAGAMLHLAPMTALVRCACEIDGMAERQLWAESDARAATKCDNWCSALVGGSEPRLTNAATHAFFREVQKAAVEH